MLTEGRVIGERYEIMSSVGSGGMADVYKAKDLRLSRFVAIKVLKQEFSSDKNFVTKFRGEAQSAAGLSHPNVVNVFDVGEEDGIYYIVMELVEGITLKKFIERKGKLEVREAVGIAIQISQGMEAAHSNHIIHRDIKPQNVIISREGKVKVTDFGIAKAATSNTITAGAMGSVHYISPEQARGGYSDEKSDIYSLGVTLYEMLSGKMPFAADNTVSVALLHIQEEATPLRELDPTIPVSIERIVQKCMQKKPERRYLAASELIKDLKRAITDPDGDFVRIGAGALVDSPTIDLSDEELARIKNARYSQDLDSSMPPSELPVNEAKEPRGEKPAVLDVDDGDEMDPKMEKFMLIGGIAAIAILAVVIIVLLVKGFHLFSKTDTNEGNGEPGAVTGPAVTGPAVDSENGTDEGGADEGGTDADGDEEDPDADAVSVPDVKNKTLSEATAMLEAAGLRSYRYETQASDTFEKDTVMSQTPEAGAEVDPTTEIMLVVSDGEPLVEVPDVYNRLQEEAETILSDEGFNVKHDYQYNDSLDEGRVISTLPERGTAVRKESDVTIIISRGPEKVLATVPNLIGKTEADALQLLQNAGLRGNVTYMHHDTVEKNQVITQDTTVGSSVEQGAAIGFSVSLGKEEPTYSYVGSVTIDFQVNSPFTEEKQSAYIRIVMDQPGEGDEAGQEGIVLQEGTFTSANFPMKITGITGVNGLQATVYAEIDGELYQDSVWWADFVQVEN